MRWKDNQLQMTAFLSWIVSLTYLACHHVSVAILKAKIYNKDKHAKYKCLQWFDDGERQHHNTSYLESAIYYLDYYEPLASKYYHKCSNTIFSLTKF